MGCDIHFHIELQKDDGEWVHYAAPHIARNYQLFGLLANVRNSFGIVPVSNPKGLPKDISLITKIDCLSFGENGHSHSWIGSNEMVQLNHSLEEIAKTCDIAHMFRLWRLEGDILHTYLFNNRFVDFPKNKEILPKPFTDVRFVFWFDN